MVKPIPDEVKDILAGLSTAQQVIMKGYIASLRSEIKDMETEMITKNDPDPNAHYHGHDKCTEDHGHKEHDHKEDKHEHKSHDHHDDKKPCTANHDHGSHDHKEHEHKSHDHKEHDHKEHEHKSHDHKEHDHGDKPCTANHDHKSHDHKEHDHSNTASGHEHDHDQKMPDWKKQALESGADAGAAPFGGSWNNETEMNIK